MDAEKVANSEPKESFDSSLTSNEIPSGYRYILGGKSVENAPNILIVALMLGFLSAHETFKELE